MVGAGGETAHRRAAIFTAEDAKDAKDCFGNHPDEPLRHAIQKPGVN